MGILKGGEAGEIEREIIRNNPLNILVAIENGEGRKPRKSLEREPGIHGTAV